MLIEQTWQFRKNIEWYVSDKYNYSRITSFIIFSISRVIQYCGTDYKVILYIYLL
jgi:hypothetical protein